MAERLERYVSMNNVVMEGTDSIIMKKSNRSHPFDQNLLNPYSLIFTIISIMKKMVMKMSMCESIELRMPDSVRNIINVLMVIIDRMTLSLRNIFLNLLCIIIYDLIDSKIKKIFLLLFYIFLT